MNNKDKTQNNKKSEPRNPTCHISADTKRKLSKILFDENKKRKCTKIVPDDVIRRLLPLITDEMFDDIEKEKRRVEDKEDIVFVAFRKKHKNATLKDYKNFQYDHPREWAELAESVKKVS